MDEYHGCKPEGAPPRASHAGEGAPSGGDASTPQRFSAPRKVTAAMRVLRGEPLEGVARELNVTVARLSEWRDRALAGALAALKERERDERDAENARLMAKLGEITMDNELLREKIAALEGKRPRASALGQVPFGPTEVETMSQTLSSSTGRCYGLARVARVWAVSRATVYRHRSRAAERDGDRPPPVRPRPGPVGPGPDAELVVHIRQQILASRFHGEGYRKIWARLRHAGVRTSPRRVRRLMGEHGLLAPHRVGRPGPRAHDGTIITETVNTMWGTDMTETVTVQDGVARVFVAVDHANSEVVGCHVSKSGNRFEALEPIRQGVLRHFGSIGPGVATGLTLRHDHGSNYMSGDFQAEIKCLGITSSPSFVREPEGNGVAEHFIRMLKENFLWVYTFETVEELRRVLLEFARHYNETWLVARHGHRTPAQVRADQLRVDRAPADELSLAA